MLSFENDYNRGAHEFILRRLLETNLEQETGYGNDRFCASAREKICQACDSPDADVFFLVGGTQTNATVIHSLLKPYEGVVAASTGHVNVHESGAIEFGGHKVLTVPEHDGKIAAEDLEKLLTTFWGILPLNTWFFPEWSIFPILRKWVPFTAKKSLRLCLKFAAAMKFPFM